LVALAGFLFSLILMFHYKTIYQDMRFL
jgi:hypothetical protein